MGSAAEEDSSTKTKSEGSQKAAPVIEKSSDQEEGIQEGSYTAMKSVINCEKTLSMGNVANANKDNSTKREVILW